MVKDFSLLALEKIMKKAGAERVSVSACKEMKVLATDISENLAKAAVEMARHAKRVTVKKEDISLVCRM